jgi:hypothetical protein
VVENAGQGSDTVRFSLGKYTLPANVENLVLTASTPQAGYGNALNNTMWTNHATSTLSGGDGNDTLIYQGGTATLTGGAGHDTFQLAAVPSSTPVNITDFVRGTDHLDLSPLLDAYHGTNPVADGWVKFVHETGGLGVYVDTDGPSGAAGMVEVAKLTGVTVSTLSSTDWIF